MILAIGIPHPEFFSFGSIKTILRQSALVGIIAFGMVYLVAMVEIDLSVGGIFAVAAQPAGIAHEVLSRRSVDRCRIGADRGHRARRVQRRADQPAESATHHRLAWNIVRLISGCISLCQTAKRSTACRRIIRSSGCSAATCCSSRHRCGPRIVCAIVLYFVFIHTRFGATVRAIGSNPAAAEFIGVRTDLIRIYATALVGFLAALSGVMALAYFKAVDTSSGRSLGLQVIAAVVIGGTSLAGGSGTIVGAALGVLIITTIDSGLVFYNVNLNYSEFVTGIVIVGAIALDRIAKRRRARLRA